MSSAARKIIAEYEADIRKAHRDKDTINEASIYNSLGAALRSAGELAEVRDAP